MLGFLSGFKNAVVDLWESAFKVSYADEMPKLDPQRAYMWEVRMRNKFSGTEDIHLYAKQTVAPPRMIENHKRWYKSVEYSYAGRDISPRIYRVTFWDNEKLEVYRFFNKWIELTNAGRDHTGALPDEILGEIDLHLLTSSGVRKNEKRISPTLIKLFDAWPTEVGEVSLSYSESSEFTFDVMFSYRHREIDTESAIDNIGAGIRAGFNNVINSITW